MKSTRFGSDNQRDIPPHSDTASGKHEVARFAHGSNDQSRYHSLSSNDTEKNDSGNASRADLSNADRDGFSLPRLQVTDSAANNDFNDSSSFSSSFSANQRRSSWIQSIFRRTCQCLRLTRPRGTTPLLDFAAMMKSLLAAISILNLLNPDKILVSQDDVFTPPCGAWSCPYVVIPEWLLRQQCQPTLRIGNQLYIFQVFLVCNQITFATTSFLIHVNPRRILNRSQMRVFLSFFLGICSFVFGFCKIVLLISIPITASISFNCYESKSGMMTDRCSDISVAIPGSYFQRDSFVIPSCSNQFSSQLPIEVYLLSLTFVLTFLYSLFMCDTVLHYGEDEEVEKTTRFSDKNPEVSIDAADQSLIDDKPKHQTDEEEGAESDEKSPSPLPQTSNIRARTVIDSSHSNAGGKHLVNGVDVMFEHQRAIKAAQSLTAQELLVCQIASAHMNQIQQKMKAHQYTYRMMRDLATLFKFIVTVVSLCLLLYNVTNSIVFCDRHQSPLDTFFSLTPSSILSQCRPQLRSYTDSFYFASAAALGAVVFIFIIILEKKVLVPRHSKFVSFVCLGAVSLLLVVQLSLMVDLDSMPLVFPCNFGSTVIMGNETLPVTEWSICDSVQLNVTATPQGGKQPVYDLVECSDRCYVNLGAGSYTLFASLALTLIYMGSLTWQYHRLAKVVIRAPLKSKREEQKSLGENETEMARGIVMDIMSKS